MSQGLPNPTDSDETQGASASATTSESQKPAAANAIAILGGVTGFANALQEDERLIGGILISIPVVLATIIFAIPAEQRFTLTCLMVGSVLIVGFIIFLLIKNKSKRDKENVSKNYELEHSNRALEQSKLEIEDQLKGFRNRLSNSTRQRRSFLFKLNDQVNRILEQAEILLQNDEITRDEVLEVNQQVSSLAQQIQEELSILRGTQGSLSDAEDLEAVDLAFERELIERFNQKQ